MKQSKAEKLAKYLMSSSGGEASTLQLYDTTGRNLGGWSKECLIDAVRKHYPERGRAKKRPRMRTIAQQVQLERLADDAHNRGLDRKAKKKVKR